ncbi:hypothetical protein ACWOEH_06750 [Enterococcus nangangensis]
MDRKAKVYLNLLVLWLLAMDVFLVVASIFCFVSKKHFWMFFLLIWLIVFVRLTFEAVKIYKE